MSREYIDKFIELFEAVWARPLMYFGKYDTDAVVLFTHGLYMSLSLTNHSFPALEIYREVSKNRGWHFNALGIVPDMKAKGLSNEEMVKELVSVEIEVWKTFRNNFEE
jgi:hypothetical protein